MDILKAQVIFIIGANPAENHPVYGARIKKAVRKYGAKLIVADPRKTELAKMAHIHLRHKPGTDILLISAMLKVILDEKLYKEDFIKERTTGFENLVESLKNFDIDRASEITGVPKEKIKVEIGARNDELIIPRIRRCHHHPTVRSSPL